MSDTASQPRVRSLLQQLTSFRPVDLPDDGVGVVLELGVTEDDEGTRVVGWAPGADVVWVCSPMGEPRAQVRVDRGFVALPLLEEEGLSLATSPEGAPTLRLPTRATPLPAPAPVQGLDVATQALALGNDEEAAARLRALAREASSLVQARLAEDAADAIDGARRMRQPTAAVGRCASVLAWRSWSGLVAVSAPVARGGASADDLDPDLAAALERGGRLGRAQARIARGLPGNSPAAPPTIERTPSLVALRDPGGMLALPAALAAYSRELDLPLPGDLVALGGLDQAGLITPLPAEHQALALATVARERRGARVVLSARSPAEETPGLTRLRAETLDDAVRLTLGEGSRASGAEALAPAADARVLDEAERDERDYRREDALTKARAFLATGRGTAAERLRAQWLEGACLVHLGRPEEARTSFDLAWRLLRDVERAGPLDRAVAVYLAMAEADGFTDLFRYADALAALEQGRELAGVASALRAKLDAFQGFVLTHAGRAAEAAVLLERACAHALPADAPRFRCWLGNALADLGDHADAAAELARGLDLAAAVGGGALAANQVYLHLAGARLELRRLDAGRALGRAEEGLAVARADARLAPYPLSSLLHARGAAMVLAGDHDRGITALEEARALSAPTPFMALVFGRSELERARALVERASDGVPARDALRRCRELVGGYAPARARFASELAALAEPGSAAWLALTDLLLALKY
jgi:tetratricopeptide (TPR) repeat protein